MTLLLPEGNELVCCIKTTTAENKYEITCSLYINLLLPLRVITCNCFCMKMNRSTLVYSQKDNKHIKYDGHDEVH